MRKWLFSSLAVISLATACQRNTADEGSSDVDSMSATSDSIAPADRTYVDPDTVSLVADSISQTNDTTTTGSGDSKRPGQMPKPGKPSKVDSIKNSYPSKRQ